MAVRIGELRNEVEMAAATPAESTAAAPTVRRPRWSDLERHRDVTEALARDIARTVTGERHG